MPVKELESININYVFEGTTYIIKNRGVFTTDGQFVCTCDLTGTIFFGNQDAHVTIARNCLTAYFEGVNRNARD